MKKKENISLDDHKVWASYVEEMKDVYDKDLILEKEKFYKNKIRTIDLHGLSLEKANQNVKQFINDSFEKNFKKIKIITGKGRRSKVKENPYISNELSILKNSVPEFIKKEKDLLNKIQKIYKNCKNGKDGAFYILLKKFKE